MPPSVIAIIGGADPDRNDARSPGRYDPPVDVAAADDMAAAIGGELARRGHAIFVYHSGRAFIEAKVVEGYVAANPARGGSIIVRQPQLQVPAIFAEEATHPKLFARRLDTSDEWEVSFYRSLADSDGVVLIGGGYSTFTAGQVAIGARIPILALDQTGGAARKVWKTLSPGVDLPTADEHARMAHALSTEALKQWIDGLEAQRRRRYAVETRPIRRHARLAAVLFVAALATAIGSHLIPWLARTGWGMALLVASTLLGGGAGSAIRMVFERRYGAGPLVPPSIAVTLALGMMAGGLGGLLYLVAQTSTTQLDSPEALRFVSIIAVVSVVAGLTVESVFRKLLGIDVVQTGAIAVRSERQPPPSS